MGGEGPPTCGPAALDGAAIRQRQRWRGGQEVPRGGAAHTSPLPFWSATARGSSVSCSAARMACGGTGEGGEALGGAVGRLGTPTGKGACWRRCMRAGPRGATPLPTFPIAALACQCTRSVHQRPHLRVVADEHDDEASGGDAGARGGAVAARQPLLEDEHLGATGWPVGREDGRRVSVRAWAWGNGAGRRRQQARRLRVGAAAVRPAGGPALCHWGNAAHPPGW